MRMPVEEGNTKMEGWDASAGKVMPSLMANVFRTYMHGVRHTARFKLQLKATTSVMQECGGFVA